MGRRGQRGLESHRAPGFPTRRCPCSGRVPAAGAQPRCSGAAAPGSRSPAPFPQRLRNLPGAAVVILFGQRTAFTEGQVCGPRSLAGHEEKSRGRWQPPFSRFTSCCQVWSPRRPPQQSEVLREPLQDSDLSKSRGGLANTSRLSSGDGSRCPPRKHSQLPVCPCPHLPAFPFLIHTSRLLAAAHAVPSAQITSLWPLPPRSSCLENSLLLQGELGLGTQEGRSCLPTTRAPPPLHAAHVAEMTYFHVCPTVWLNE